MSKREHMLKGDKQTITAADGSTAILKKHSRRAYSLTLTRKSARNRWGNWTEIQADVEHFKIYGKLPPATAGGWA